MEDTVAVRIEELIENSTEIGQFGVHLYNLISSIAPILHCAYWLLIELFGQANRFFIYSLKGKYYTKLLEIFRPDVVLTYA